MFCCQSNQVSELKCNWFITEQWIVFIISKLWAYFPYITYYEHFKCHFFWEHLSHINYHLPLSWSKIIRFIMIKRIVSIKRPIFLFSHDKMGYFVCPGKTIHFPFNIVWFGTEQYRIIFGIGLFNWTGQARNSVP